MTKPRRDYHQRLADSCKTCRYEQCRTREVASDQWSLGQWCRLRRRWVENDETCDAYRDYRECKPKEEKP